MQSILQYRRLRQEIQDDLARARQDEQSSRTSISTSMPSFETNANKAADVEAGVTEKPAMLPDTPLVPGVTVSHPHGVDGDVVFVVGWKGNNDPSNPQNWSLLRKCVVMITCCIVAIAMTIPSSVEGATQGAFDARFRVNDMAGSMTTGK
jgi:hypothetical protein